MPPSAVKSLGEVALRVNDLPRMKHFYSSVLGLEILGEFDKAVFFKVAEGYGGHTQVLALFDRSVRVGPERSAVDHFAFTIALDDYDAERKRLESLGLEVEVERHPWVRWRSLYFHDPERNQVELVCYDESLGGEGS